MFVLVGSVRAKKYATHPSVHCTWRANTMDTCDPRIREGNETMLLAWLKDGADPDRAKFFNVIGRPASIFPKTGRIIDTIVLCSLHYVIPFTKLETTSGSYSNAAMRSGSRLCFFALFFDSTKTHKPTKKAGSQSHRPTTPHTRHPPHQATAL